MDSRTEAETCKYRFNEKCPGRAAHLEAKWQNLDEQDRDVVDLLGDRNAADRACRACRERFNRLHSKYRMDTVGESSAENTEILDSSR
ncbi:MAG: hypothetical protein FWC00_05360 [Firmicutes bacterium]|nr:hypothetical protein [Bacillota bacterium]